MELPTLSGKVDEWVASTQTQRLSMAGILQQAPVAMIVAEAPSGRIVFANNEVERIMRAPAPTFGRVGEHPLVTGSHPHGPALTHEEWPLVRALSGEDVRGELIEIMRGDGTRTMIEASATPVRDERGEIVAAVALFQDVAARERSDAAEREFVANAAHELQSPVAAISSAVEALQSGAKDDDAERDRFLAHLERDVKRLGRLSSALLAIARAERAGEPPRTELLALKPLLEEAVAVLTPAQGVVLRVECTDDIAALTHREMFLQVLTNLCTNAVRATRNGEIVLSAQLTGRMRVVVRVADTGVGIAPEHREHVFERFYRGNRLAGGTGLGLAIVEQSIRLLDGRLELNSELGSGTTVSIELPGARLVQ